MVKNPLAMQETWVRSLGTAIPHAAWCGKQRNKKNSWNSECNVGFSDGSVVKAPPHNAGNPGSIPGLGRSQEKGMAIHPSILAWRIPWTEETGGIQSMVSQKV